MREIPLTQGKAAFVSERDYARVAKYKWWASKSFSGKTWYAVACKGKLRMHRFILNAREGQHVDHRDHNGLNNIRGNIRLVSRSQNGMNRESYRGSSSKFKGVSCSKTLGKWAAYIQVDKKLRHIGEFDRETDAAHAYDLFAVRHFGRFAYLNFPKATAQKRQCAYGRRCRRSRQSRYRGVVLHRNGKYVRWTCDVWHAGKVTRGGYHKTQIAAARAYDELALRLIGPEAKLNFPGKGK